MVYKVIVWGTGLVGQAVLRDLIDNPVYDVVAVIVNDGEKVGKDVVDIAYAGLANRPSLSGLLATNDVDAALALEADAVAYFGPSAMYADINIANLSRALRSGKNVVDTSMGAFENPKRAAKELLDPINEACALHGKTFFSGGIDPGFGNDLMPITLLGVCSKVERVRTIEFIDAGTYPDQQSLIQMGLTSRAEEDAILDIPGIMTSVWGGPLYMIAEALGVEIENTKEVYRRWFTPEAVDYPLGRVEAGQCAAHQIELQGIVNGEPKIIIDHYHRLYADAAPEWQRPLTNPVHANRIEIDGNPTIRQETVLEDVITGDSNAGTCLATGMRAINAIPSVCGAPSGIISTLDLPLFASLGTMR